MTLQQFASPYTIQIRPSGSAVTRKIEGTAVGTGVPMIDVSGADRVRFNGADSSTNSGQYFRFINNNATAASTGPVFRFVNDARQDSVRNCIIESNATLASSSLIYIATTTGSSGNDSIFVDNCLFKQSAGTNAGRYFKAILSSGTTTLPAQRNSDNYITNCNFTGFSATTQGVITISTGNGDNWYIGNNKIYNDIVMTPTTADTLINVNSSFSNNVTITGNSIGGSNPDRSGTFLGPNSGVNSIAIFLTAGINSASNIQGNTIGNYGNSNVDGAIISGIGTGIKIVGGKINVGTTVGNTLGGLVNPWDSLSSGYDNGFIWNTLSTDTVRIENNLIGNANYRRGSNDRLAGIFCEAGVNIVRNNIVRDFTGNNTNAGYTSGFITAPIRMASSTNGQIVEGNTIYNITNTNLVQANYRVPGIDVLNTGSISIYRNKVYNLNALHNGTGTNAAVLVGINVGAAANANIYNNMISLSPTNGEQIVKGINFFSTGSNSVLYNSVYIGGTCANVSNTSHCYYRQSTSIDTVRNNLFFNERTGGANNYCIGVVSATNWTSGSANYNAYLPAGANQVGEIATNIQQTFANWKINAIGDASSVSQTGITANSLFTATAAADLNIIASNSECWYVSGLGTPLTTPQVSSDYGSSSAVRSITIAGGSTDIGADEFNPVGSRPDVTASGAPANNTTTTYTYMGRTLASITWGAGGTVPTGISFKYYPGQNPPGSTGYNVGNAYWEVTATGGSGFTYDITFNYDDAILGTISNESKIRLAKSDNGDTSYRAYITPDDGSHGAGMYVLNTSNNSILVYGLTGFSTFALADADAPLPVELASFNAKANRNEVELNWGTTSEVNNARFEIERKTETSSAWKNAGSVAGNGTTNTPHNYSFTDKNLETGKYYYRLKQIDNNGNFKYHQLNTMVEVGVPAKYDLSQNYPNPFNPTTKINYVLPFDSKVSVKLFDMTGREVAVIVSGVQQAGFYTVQFNGANLASGVYFYNIIAEGGKSSKFVATKKMVLVK